MQTVSSSRNSTRKRGPPVSFLFHFRVRGVLTAFSSSPPLFFHAFQEQPASVISPLFPHGPRGVRFAFFLSRNFESVPVLSNEFSLSGRYDPTVSFLESPRDLLSGRTAGVFISLSPFSRRDPILFVPNDTGFAPPTRFSWHDRVSPLSPSLYGACPFPLDDVFIPPALFRVVPLDPPSPLMNTNGQGFFSLLHTTELGGGDRRSGQLSRPFPAALQHEGVAAPGSRSIDCKRTPALLEVSLQSPVLPLTR